MSKAAAKTNRDPANVDGLDDIFDADDVLISNDVGTVPIDSADTNPRGVGMPLKKACIYYKMSSSTLREKIKIGEIPARKVASPYGPAWLVYPRQSTVRESSTDGADRKTIVTPINATSIPETSLTQLIELVGTQAEKLEAASGQIGYLSAQIETYQNQVRLLPDLQIQASRAIEQEEKISEQAEKLSKMEQELNRVKASWWYRFWHHRQSDS